MVEWHMKSRRKTSGGIKRTDRRSTKKLAWRGGTFSETRLSEKEYRVISDGRGNSNKIQLRYAINANVTDPSTNKKHKLKIMNIVQNDANRQYARRNIITKGAVIEVELNGKKHAKVTSRPGQQGIINAIIIDEIEAKPKKKKLLRKTLAKPVSKKSKETKEKPVEEKKELKEKKIKTEEKEIKSIESKETVKEIKAEAFAEPKKESEQFLEKTKEKEEK